MIIWVLRLFVYLIYTLMCISNEYKMGILRVTIIMDNQLHRVIKRLENMTIKMQHGGVVLNY